MRAKTITPIAFLVFLITACSTDALVPETGSGRLLIRLTDAPFPHDRVSEVRVRISKISVNKLGKTTPLSNTAKDKIHSGPVLKKEIEVNLLQLTNGITMPLADVELEAGKYHSINLYVTAAEVILKDGTVFPMNIPKGEFAAIPVSLSPYLEIAPGLVSDILLDFDVSRSFMPRGNPAANMGIGGFIYRPFVKASNSNTSGIVFGHIGRKLGEDQLGLEGAQLSVYRADTLNTTTFTDRDGNFTILGLKPGACTLKVELDGYEAAQEATTIHGPDQPAQVNFLLSPTP